MSEAAASQRGSLGERLEALADAGVAGYDAPAIVLIEGLLERSSGIDAATRTRVEARAHARLARLEGEFEVARAAARARLERIEAELGEVPAPLEEALASGRFEVIARAQARLCASAPVLAVDRDAEAAYREAVADFTSALSRARAPRVADEEAGQLNGRLLAERALRAAERSSPAYRRSLVIGLADLAALMHLPPAKVPRKRQPG